jgi:hypothetical protein
MKLQANTTKLFNLFTVAMGALKRPIIRLSVDGIPMKLKYKMTSGGSRIYINGDYPDTFGTIYPDGRIFLTQAGGQIVNLPKMLGILCNDPLKVALGYGKLTGSCCFCGLDLSTEESVGAGYGPICAANWGLPWGHVTATQNLEPLAVG